MEARFCEGSNVIFSFCQSLWKMHITQYENLVFRSELTLPLSWWGRYHIETSPLICRAMDWFPYDNGLRHERVMEEFVILFRDKNRLVSSAKILGSRIWETLQRSFPYNIKAMDLKWILVEHHILCLRWLFLMNLAYFSRE